MTAVSPAHDASWPSNKLRFGIRRLLARAQRGALRIPVVDVAQSEKLRYESPMIGLSVAHGVVSDLADHDHLFGRHLLTIGYGAVGAAVAHYLRAFGYDVSVYDHRLEARLAAAADDFPVADTDEFFRFDAGIGVTGTNLARLIRYFRPGTPLYNGASGIGEWLTPEMERFDFTDDRQTRLVPLFGARGEYFVRSRAPVNFRNHPEPIPPRYIQLTRGLLYLGVLSAVEQAAAGVHALPQAPQRAFIEAVEMDLGRSDESLLDPRF